MEGEAGEARWQRSCIAYKPIIFRSVNRSQIRRNRERQGRKSGLKASVLRMGGSATRDKRGLAGRKGMEGRRRNSIHLCSSPPFSVFGCFSVVPDGAYFSSPPLMVCFHLAH